MAFKFKRRSRKYQQGGPTVSVGRQRQFAPIQAQGTPRAGALTSAPVNVQPVFQGLQEQRVREQNRYQRDKDEADWLRGRLDILDAQISTSVDGLTQLDLSNPAQLEKYNSMMKTIDASQQQIYAMLADESISKEKRQLLFSQYGRQIGNQLLDKDYLQMVGANEYIKTINKAINEDISDPNLLTDTKKLNNILNAIKTYQAGGSKNCGEFDTCVEGISDIASLQRYVGSNYGKAVVNSSVPKSDLEQIGTLIDGVVTNDCNDVAMRVRQIGEGKLSTAVTEKILKGCSDPNLTEESEGFIESIIDDYLSTSINREYALKNNIGGDCSEETPENIEQCVRNNLVNKYKLLGKSARLAKGQRVEDVAVMDPKKFIGAGATGTNISSCVTALTKNKVYSGGEAGLAQADLHCRLLLNEQNPMNIGSDQNMIKNIYDAGITDETTLRNVINNILKYYEETGDWDQAADNAISDEIAIADVDKMQGLKNDLIIIGQRLNQNKQSISQAAGQTPASPAAPAAPAAPATGSQTTAQQPQQQPEPAVTNPLPDDENSGYSLFMTPAPAAEEQAETPAEEQAETPAEEQAETPAEEQSEIQAGAEEPSFFSRYELPATQIPTGGISAPQTPQVARPQPPAQTRTPEAQPQAVEPIPIKGVNGKETSVNIDVGSMSPQVRELVTSPEKITSKEIKGVVSNQQPSIPEIGALVLKAEDGKSEVAALPAGEIKSLPINSIVDNPPEILANSKVISVANEAIPDEERDATILEPLPNERFGEPRIIIAPNKIEMADNEILVPSKVNEQPVVPSTPKSNSRVRAAYGGVKPLQRMLKNAGLYNLGIDGKWGPGTDKAFDELKDVVYSNEAESVSALSRAGSYIMGAGDKHITHNSLDDNDIELLREVAMREGGGLDKGYVTYSDLRKGTSLEGIEVSDYWKHPLAVAGNLTVANMSLLLGQFNVIQAPDGGVYVIDTYDFNDAKGSKDPDKAYEERIKGAKKRGEMDDKTSEIYSKIRGRASKRQAQRNVEGKIDPIVLVYLGQAEELYERYRS